MKKTIIVVCVMLMALPTSAQFGDVLKKAGKNVLRKGTEIAKKEGVNLLKKELNKTKAKFDSTSFSYAIALSDKSGQFESKDKLSDVVSLGTLLYQDQSDKTPVDEAREYMDVGEMAYAANGYALAESSFLSALGILKLSGNETHPLYGRGLANLGLLYSTLGRYSLAEEFTNKSLVVREKYRGRNSIDYAASLNNLAVLHKDLGDYNQAEKEISEAIELNRQTAGPESVAYAISLNNRGVLYQVLGRYEEAEKDLKQALAVAAKNFKPASLQYNRLQTNLALLYQQQGRYQEAEAIFKEAVNAIAKNPLTNKKANPDYAYMIEMLASLYTVMDRAEEAEKLLLEALAVYERKFGTSHASYGLAAARLGALYLRTRSYKEALRYLTIARSVIQATYGDKHPNMVKLQSQMGLLMWRMGQLADAYEYFTEALDASLDFIGKYFAPMSDNEKAQYWQTLQPRFEQFYAFVADQNDKTYTRQALQYRLATKAMLLSGTTRARNRILQSGDEQLIKDYQTWVDSKNALARYYNMSRELLHEQKINLDSMERATNNLEKSLSERSGIFNETFKASIPAVRDIQALLADGEKAVELIKISGFLDVPPMYLAIVLSQDDLQQVKLADGVDLDGKYFKYYRNMIRFKKEDNKTYGWYWQPIDELLGSAQRVYVSADGVYNQISIAALQISEGLYGMDKRQYLLVSSLRELKQSAPDSKQKTATFFGNPDYGSEQINPLPGTLQEVKSVSIIMSKAGFKTNVFTGKQASETQFKKMAGNKVLHLATHGFFVADPKARDAVVYSVPLYNVQENVLLRSGLLLAGAGRTTPDVTDLGATDNGIVTAYEAMNLNLDNTDLVVLSACETGLGDVMAGEGVYGLQRAFLVAGANRVLMSLWKVDDAATKELMEAFYRNWLRYGSYEKAFVEARKELRQRYPQPYYWGAFVMLKN